MELAHSSGEKLDTFRFKEKKGKNYITDIGMNEFKKLCRHVVGKNTVENVKGRSIYLGIGILSCCMETDWSFANNQFLCVSL